MKPEQMTEWREEFDKKANAVVKTFSTTDGKKVIEILRTHFGASAVFDENPYKMARNAGQHELVQYLEALIERGNTHE